MLPGARRHEDLAQLPAARALGRLGRATTRRRGPRKVDARTTCSSRRPASTARRPAGCSPTSTRTTCTIRKFEGNPRPPGQPRAQLRQGPGDDQPGRRPRAHPLPAAARGARGEGKWERVTWDEVLDDIGGRIRAAIVEGPARRGDVPRRPARRGRLHRARPARLGHRRPQLATPTSARPGARLGYAFWDGLDRPSPDYANARVILLLSLAPRGRPLLQPARPADHRGQAGRRQDRSCSTRACPTPRRMADYWLLAWPGSEAALLLAMARAAARRRAATTASSCRRWVNWETYLADAAPEPPRDVRQRSSRR